MDSIFILYLLFSSASIASAQGSTQCSACNCQFNNVDALDQLIDRKLAAAPQPVSGVAYIRWGKSSCPSDTGAQLVYSGRAGGTNYNVRGGSAERICLPNDPVYVPETSGVTLAYHSVVQGAEYEFYVGPAANVSNHNVPCVVCYVPTRAVTIMIPAKPTCPSSWTREYFGYLTTDLDAYYRTTFTCIDSSPDVIGESSGNEDGALFHHTTTDCNGLPCPPYEATRILSCAVCTK